MQLFDITAYLITGIKNIRVGCMLSREVSPVCCCCCCCFFCRRSSVNFCWVEFRFKLRDWACSKFAIIPFHSTFQYIPFAYNLIIGRCKTASQNQLERAGTGLKLVVWRFCQDPDSKVWQNQSSISTRNCS